jgi:cell division septum initiation protein DivIVA
MQKIVENGSTLPFSSKALINPEEALDILDDIREALPDELVQAQEVLSKKNAILVEAQNDADRIRSEATKRLEEMINTNEITRNATEQAERILENAQNSAKDIRVGTQHYSDKILYKLQVQLKAINDTIEEDRKELKTIK